MMKQPNKQEIITAIKAGNRRDQDMGLTKIDLSNIKSLGLCPFLKHPSVKCMANQKRDPIQYQCRCRK